ncbi:MULTISPECIES: ABC transporter permease [Atopobiaceae]|uniref:Monosaccharide ABC transporter membrane protein, CUT2 family n=1 Tax=Parafannyhessea umbonata TaxID=604330 RepID=A0A1H9PJM6_9ACTN|nr:MULTISPECIES: ABC transporter permease [Atopobiaceae]SEH51122.1 monosaccharide ABC transporter membrane protein, CUT2 family [Parafannyhessea umbonata]SER48388.1 monosaccharide ABC transporter membrane protein, CUT2 family [Parafannyhessea umbonata]SJZ75575.1 ribose transport system permease protein [Olsenella sp. KH1P3]
MQSFLKKAKQSQWYGVGLLALIALAIWAVFKVGAPATFGAPDKLMSYLQSALIYAIGGCGMYFICVMGLFDFSIGSILIAAELAAIALIPTLGWFSVIVVPVVVGVILGLTNGIAYIKMHIPSIIVTTGLSLIYESFSVWIADVNGTRLDDAYKLFGSYPWNLIVALLAFLLCWFILNYTKIGTYTNAIGANELVAKNMGVDVDKYKAIAFTLCGTFMGVMSILYLGYGTAQTPQTGMLSQALNFQPLMGTFFGLAFKKYGHPVLSILMGEYIVAMIFAGFVALGMPTTVNNIVTGVTLLAIVTLTTKRRNGAVVK